MSGPIEFMTDFLWLYGASLAYFAMAKCVVWALRPELKPLPDPDWFWTGGAWVRADEGINVSWVQSIDPTNPEPSDPPASKPESEAD